MRVSEKCRCSKEDVGIVRVSEGEGDHCTGV